MSLSQVIEALLFSAQKALTSRELVAAIKGAGAEDELMPNEFAKATEAQVAAALEQLKIEYIEQGRAFQLTEKAEGWQLVSDPAGWRSFPGTDVEYRLLHQQPPNRIDYEVLTGLPTRDHHGHVELLVMAPASTEIVWSESFRPRMVGTGGFLRTRIESHLVAAARDVVERSERVDP